MSERTRDEDRTPYRTILLLGPPGSGKGTQGRILGEVPGFHFLSMGEVLRSLDPEGEQGRRVQGYLRAGDLAPAGLVIGIWMQRMVGLVSSGYRPDRDRLVLDGIPRNVEQMERLRPHLAVEKVIHLAADEDLLIRRIRARSAGRNDDVKDDIVRHRFEVYRRETEPLLDRLPQGAIVHVDAAPPPLEVLLQIVQAIVPGSAPPRLPKHDE